MQQFPPLRYIFFSLHRVWDFFRSVPVRVPAVAPSHCLPSLPPSHPIAIRPRVTPHHRRRFTSSQCCTMTVVTIAIIIIIVVDGFRESKGRGGFYPFLRDVRRSTTASDCRGLRERERTCPLLLFFSRLSFFTPPHFPCRVLLPPFAHPSCELFFFYLIRFFFFLSVLTGIFATAR